MSLAIAILLPALAGFVAWRVEARASSLGQALMLLSLGLSAWMVWGAWSGPAPAHAPFAYYWSVPWVQSLGLNFALALDGFSAPLALLTCGIGAIAVVLAAYQQRASRGLYRMLLMLGLAATLGSFLAADLLLFFLFFELMLLPACALIAFWGSGPAPERAALRYFIYAQTGSLLFLVALLGLHTMHRIEFGTATFDPGQLAATPLRELTAALLFGGFMAAFLVKLPAVPFHSWQPPAYSIAPPETAMVLSALMAKAAGFGILRYAVPLFPGAVADYSFALAVLGAASVLYGAFMAYGQTELRKLIAYSSMGHLGYIVLAASAQQPLAFTGAAFLMLAHGLSVAGLFTTAAVIEHATGRPGLDGFHGLAHRSPRAAGVALLFVMATLGLPGLANFVGEFLVLAGLYQTHPGAAVAAVAGTVLSVAYSLRFASLVVFAPKDRSAARLPHWPRPLVFACLLLAVTLVWLGLRPQPLLQAIPEASAYGAPPVTYAVGEARQ